jgi:hypothetical protein
MKRHIIYKKICTIPRFAFSDAHANCGSIDTGSELALACFFLEGMTKKIASTLVEVFLIKRLKCVVIELQARCLLVCLHRSLQLADAGTGVKRKDGLARHPMNWQDGTIAMVHHLLGKGVLVRIPSEHFVVVDELFVEEFYATWCTGTLSGWCALGGHEREKMEARKWK